MVAIPDVSVNLDMLGIPRQESAYRPVSALHLNQNAQGMKNTGLVTTAARRTATVTTANMTNILVRKDASANQATQGSTTNVSQDPSASRALLTNDTLSVETHARSPARRTFRGVELAKDQDASAKKDTPESTASVVLIANAQKDSVQLMRYF